MIVFELSMPNRGSWNNRWSGEDRRFIRCKREWGFSKETLKNIINKDLAICTNNDINRIKKCLGDIDNLNVVDRNGQSPLTCAIAAGSSLDIIKLLVDHGASVNYGRKTVATPLICGIMTGNEKVVGYLLSKGADPNKGIEDSKGVYALRQYVGDSPLTMARKLKRSQKIINLLQEYGAVEYSPDDDE